jgi:predicted ATPase/DNA-binding winged helix-turn-helix (wHTH) protein
MTQLPRGAVTHRFAGWELRPNERVLLVRGKPARVGSRAFDLLLALVERRDRVVPKAELLDAAWPGLVVEENNLSVQITALRKLLGAGAIVNVAGLGYRLAAAPPATAVEAPASLPAAPLLLGRDAELAALLPLVGEVALLSIVGTGGVGKTSLARAALARSPRSWRDGVHWIDLAPLRPGISLLTLVAAALGVVADDPEPASDDPALPLSQMQALVALDNCEHLLDEVAALLGPLMRQAPGIRWLATTQEPLHLAGETVFRLGPLDVPPHGARLDEAMACGAFALFCERARAADQHFALGDWLDTAIELCRQLDGLPLAIEMAVARVAALGLRGVHDQIEQRLRLRAGTRDAPQRHHTLLQTFEWSYGLLTPVEQGVFMRLEPFVGGFTAQMAQQLCSAVDAKGSLASWDAFDALGSLVDKSLVQRGTAASPGSERLRLLEACRDYARLQLDAAGETDAARQAHAEVVARFFASAETDLHRNRDDEWRAKYMPERQNLCAALAWVCSKPLPELLARLVAELAQLDTLFWAPAEIVKYPVPVDVLTAAPLRLRARACLEFGWSHFLDGNRELSTDLVTRALADFETLGEVAGIYDALTRLIRLHRGRPGMAEGARELWLRLRQIDEERVPLRIRLRSQGTVGLDFDDNSKVERLQELQRVARQAGFDAQASACRVNLTNQLLIQRRYEEAVATAREMLEVDDPHLRTRAMMWQNLALALVRLGRTDEARAAARGMLRVLPGAAHMVLDLFALDAARAGRLHDAALMAGCSASFSRERDRHSDAPEAAVIADTLPLLEQGLGHERCSGLMQAGAAMSTASLLAMALPT